MPAGLSLWLDAQDLTTLSRNRNCLGPAVAGGGAEVGCWKDKSEYGNHAQGDIGGSQFPTYNTNIIGTLGALSFSADYLKGNAGGFTHTAILVYKPDNQITRFTMNSNLLAFPGNAGIWLGSSTMAINDELFSYGGTGSPSYRSAYTSIVDNISPSAHLFVIRHTIGGNGIELRLDQIKVDDTETDAHLFSAITDQGFEIGRAFGAGTAYLSGSVGEVMTFNNRLSDTDLSAIETYLRAKWGF